MEEPKTVTHGFELLKAGKAIFLYREDAEASYLDMVNGEFIFATYDKDGMLVQWVVVTEKHAKHLLNEKLKRENV